MVNLRRERNSYKVAKVVKVIQELVRNIPILPHEGIREAGLDSNDSLVGPDSKATVNCLYSYFKLIPRCDAWCQKNNALSNKYMQKTVKLAGGL